MIRISSHRQLIEQLLQRHGLSPTDLEIVPDVATYSRANGIQDENPFRPAKCFWRSTGACHIVLREEMSNEMIESVKSALSFSGFNDELHRIATDEGFVRHTVLHEIACHVLRTADQETRDRWAFGQME